MLVHCVYLSGPILLRCHHVSVNRFVDCECKCCVCVGVCPQQSAFCEVKKVILVVKVLYVSIVFRCVRFLQWERQRIILHACLVVRIRNRYSFIQMCFRHGRKPDKITAKGILDWNLVVFFCHICQFEIDFFSSASLCRSPNRNEGVRFIRNCWIASDNRQSSMLQTMGKKDMGPLCVHKFLFAIPTFSILSTLRWSPCSATFCVYVRYRCPVIIVVVRLLTTFTYFYLPAGRQAPERKNI